MKKWITFALLSILLVACSNDEPTNEEQKAQITTTSQNEKSQAKESVATENLSYDDALKISNNIHANFAAVWLNIEDLGVTNYEMFQPSLHAQHVIDRYKAFATDNFLNETYINNLKTFCYACDALPYGDAFLYAENVSYEVLDDNNFSISGYFPLDALTPEMNVTHYYSYVDDTWKLDKTEEEILQQADGVTYSEIIRPEPTTAFQALYDKGLDEIQNFDNLMYQPQDGSLAEIANLKYESLQNLYTIIEDFEKMIQPIDPYYELNSTVWNNLVKEAVAFTEQDTVGGSGQGTFMIETEAKFAISRIHHFYYHYINDFAQ